MAVGVDVEQVIGDCCREFAEHVGVGTFADIDDTLEHPCYLANEKGRDPRLLADPAP
jgi:hypothetical protein